MPIRAIVLLLGVVWACPSVGAAVSDQVLYDGSQSLSGVSVVPDPANADERVATWKGAEKGHRLALVRDRVDLSSCKALSLRIYSETADQHQIVILCDSNGPGEGNYYHAVVTVDWAGWRSVVIPLADFQANRKPLGWQHIDTIMLANNGYAGTTANPQAMYLVDDLVALVAIPAGAQR